MYRVLGMQTGDIAESASSLCASIYGRLPCLAEHAGILLLLVVDREWKVFDETRLFLDQQQHALLRMTLP